MLIKKEQRSILIINLIIIVFFGILFTLKRNYEFILYVLVILFFFALILLTNKKVDYPKGVLWGLSLWGFLHMAGGGLTLNGTRFYELMIIPLIGAPYDVLKYDQVIHAVGFFVATLVMYSILKAQLKKNHGWVALGIVIVMAGLGAGALNEIVEFIVAVVVPESGVGGYENTALDLIANFIGALLAFGYIYWKEGKKKS